MYRPIEFTLARLMFEPDDKGRVQCSAKSDRRAFIDPASIYAVHECTHYPQGATVIKFAGDTLVVLEPIQSVVDRIAEHWAAREEG